MDRPPAVIVHGLGMARAALAPGRPVTLLSARGAGVYAGVGWWRAVVDAARASCPDTPGDDVLDCGEAPGRALEALRFGQRAVVLRCTPALWADLAERALLSRGCLLQAAPNALDLATPGAERRLREWLSE